MRVELITGGAGGGCENNGSFTLPEMDLDTDSDSDYCPDRNKE